MPEGDQKKDIAEDFPPPQFPVRKIRLVIAICVIVVLVIVAVFLWLMIRDISSGKISTPEPRSELSEDERVQFSGSEARSEAEGGTRGNAQSV